MILVVRWDENLRPVVIAQEDSNPLRKPFGHLEPCYWLLQFRDNNRGYVNMDVDNPRMEQQQKQPALDHSPKEDMQLGVGASGTKRRNLWLLKLYNFSTIPREFESDSPSLAIGPLGSHAMTPEMIAKLMTKKKVMVLKSKLISIEIQPKE